jgi:hypothetical protein
MDSRAARWIVAITGVLVLLLINGAWALELKNSNAGFFAGGLRGLIVVGGAALLIRWAMKSPKSHRSIASKTNRDVEPVQAYDPPDQDPTVFAYQTVADELDANKQDRGLWVRSFAEADGDDARTKALYIRYRVAQLVKDKEASRQLEANPPMVVRSNREAEATSVENDHLVPVKAQVTGASQEQQEDQFSAFSIVLITVFVALPLAYIAFMIVAYIVT